MVSYKQENQPAYHCRDIAIWRGRYHHCKVILGSATPSLDTYARALKNVYHLISMPDRINQSLPKVTIVSMKDSMRTGRILYSFQTVEGKDERPPGKETAGHPAAEPAEDTIPSCAAATAGRSSRVRIVIWQ
jgi:hypothetical protein